MKLLFICTHNRCRSILAEAITNHIGGGMLQARSAGSQPAGKVHPLSIHYLEEAGISTKGLQSQSWDDFEDWKPDVVITVCDSAAGEACPAWLGDSIKIHWGLADPSSIDGSEEEIANAFRKTIDLLIQRITRLKNADTNSMSKEELTTLLQSIGEV